MPFADGQRVRSVLCVVESQGLVRLDFDPEEDFDLGESRPIAQWLRTFRSNDAEKETAREAVETADDLFDQLMAEDAEDEPGDEHAEEIRKALRCILALHLERKRVLRPLGRIGQDGMQTYRHPKKDRQYEVAVVELRPDLIREIEDQLDFILI